MKSKFKKISVVIPIVNEKSGLPELVKRLTISLIKTKLDYELIFIDDNSTDGTDRYFKKVKDGHIIFQKKKGKQGKAYSLKQGFTIATGDIVCMIDGDLQYPPEAILHMVRMLNQTDIVVSNRNHYKDSFVRKLLSTTFRSVFGSVLFGLKHDIQAGLKVFKREVISVIDFTPASPWTFDLEFLFRASQAGFTIRNYEIEFTRRKNGTSKVHFIKTTVEIGLNALLLRIKKIDPVHLPSKVGGSMLGAGIGYKRKKYITHTTIPYHTSALKTFIFMQKFILLFIFVDIVLGMYIAPLLTMQIIVAVLSFIYFADVLFNLYLIRRSLVFPQEIKSTKTEIASLRNRDLPIYTILCPMYHEAHIIAHFLSAIDKISWPKSKLDVLLLLEEDDDVSIASIKKMRLPSYVRTLIVPHSMPKTKPKACNYGLAHAKGEYLVVYDVEDIPDPLQLKQAYLGFKKLGENVICLQAKLNYHNPHQNLLTRFFTAEYVLWFDITLTGLQSINTTIPLGGTSNHFKMKSLRAVEGWDPFNVTEDADLGVRLFRRGFKTAMIDSTTLEEANSQWRNWLRQRSRWIKGYMQTYLVHSRDSATLYEKQGIHALIFHLIIGGKIAFILINPLLWIATLSYFVLYSYVGPQIEALYPSVVFYMAVFSLVFGNFLFLYYYMIGVAKKGQWNLMKFILFIPLYWLMISIAAFIALYQLIFKPHYWEKTVHGLYLKKEAVNNTLKVAVVTVQTAGAVEEKQGRLTQLRVFRAGEVMSSLHQRIKRFSIGQTFTYIFSGKYRGGTLLIFSSVLANLINMTTNIVSGHLLKLSDFGVMNTFISLFYLVGIPLSALSTTMNHQTAFLLGRHKVSSLFMFWQKIRKKAFILSLLCVFIWILLSPWLSLYLNTPSMVPLLFFTPLWVFGIVGAIDSGYLKGRMLFEILSIVVIVEALTRLLFTVLFATSGLGAYVYISIPLSVLATFILVYIFVRKDKDNNVFKKEFTLPKRFYSASLLAGLSSIAFFSLDNLFVIHYLGVVEAGKYALLGLIGKMIFFTGSLTSIFIIPVISHSAGKGEQSNKLFSKLLLLTLGLTGLGYVVFALGITVSAPYVFGVKLGAIVGYLPLYGIGIALFTISQVFVSYHLAKREYIVPATAFGIAFIQILALALFHQNLSQIVIVMSMTGLVNCIVLFLVHRNLNRLEVPLNNVIDFFDLFNFRLSSSEKPVSETELNVLFLNWRDTRHLWSGGAEVYAQSIAEEFVKKNQNVTIFCGNDGLSPRNEKINGVQIIRRGGFYTVYFWAAIYYVLKFRGKFDIIIDSENGIPFFTPLYAKEKKFLLIHHVHQEVFRKSLQRPFSSIALFLEAQLMPLIYCNVQVLTVSPSSKEAILTHKLTNKEPIVIYNGVDVARFHPGKKNKTPLILYVGRLQYYKSLHVFINAAYTILKTIPDVRFVIAGKGGEKKKLEQYTRSLGIFDKITFLGHVSEEEKIRLFQKAWVFVNPSFMEGWGITTIEAAACGTPTVASDVSGLRDSIQNARTGFLVKYNDSDGFAKTIESLIESNKLRKQLANNAIVWAERFSWEKSASELYEVITRELENLNPAPSNRFALLLNRITSLF